MSFVVHALPTPKPQLLEIHRNNSLKHGLHMYLECEFHINAINNQGSLNCDEAHKTKHMIHISFHKIYALLVSN
jgi:hypothetical protein